MFVCLLNSGQTVPLISIDYDDIFDLVGIPWWADEYDRRERAIAETARKNDKTKSTMFDI